MAEWWIRSDGNTCSHLLVHLVKSIELVHVLYRLLYYFSRELAAHTNIRKFGTLISQVTDFATRLMASAVVVVYALLYGPLTAAQIFPMCTMLHFISDTLLAELASGVKGWLEVAVSVKRIEVRIEVGVSRWTGC